MIRLAASLLFISAIAAFAAWNFSGTPPAESAQAVSAHALTQLLATGLEEPLDGWRHGHLVGLHMDLEDGWKTYWRTPGESGLPPRFDWSKSKNLAEARILWPAPERIQGFGGEIYGYSDEVVLPVILLPEDATRDVDAYLTIDYLICDEVCVGVNAELALKIPTNSPKTAHAPMVREYLERVPRVGSASRTMRITEVRLGARGETSELFIALSRENGLSAPDVFIEGPAGLYFDAPVTTSSDGGTRVLLRLPIRHGRELATPGTALRITVREGTDALELAWAVGTPIAAD